MQIASPVVYLQSLVCVKTGLAGLPEALAVSQEEPPSQLQGSMVAALFLGGGGGGGVRSEE